MLLTMMLHPPNHSFPRPLACILCPWLLLFMLLVQLGCGSGSPLPDNDNPNTNDNIPDNDDQNNNANPNDNDGAPLELTVEIEGLPDDPLAVGATVQLSAVVMDSIGSLTYQWSLDPAGIVSLSDTNIANPIAMALISGQVEVTVLVTDMSADATAQANAFLVVDRGPSPPPEASLSAIDLPPVEADNQLVTLLATVSGPTPVSIVWTPDSDNPLPPEAISFQDTDVTDTMATFTTSPLLNFTYDLSFTVTATYTNGGTLSDEVTITILGGA